MKVAVSDIGFGSHSGNYRILGLLSLHDEQGRPTAVSFRLTPTNLTKNQGSSYSPDNLRFEGRLGQSQIVSVTYCTTPDPPKAIGMLGIKPYKQ